MLNYGQEAAAAYRTALEINPANRTAHRGLGLACQATGESEAAVMHNRLSYEMLHGRPWNTMPAQDKIGIYPKQGLRQSAGRVSRFKLHHDIEQLEYLIAEGRISETHRELIAAYQQIMQDLPAHLQENDPFSCHEMPEHLPHWQRFIASYQQPVYIPRQKDLQGPVINPELNVEEIEERFFDSKPNAIYIDDLLTEPALNLLRDFCLEATVWNDIRWNYLGAYLSEGFCNRLILRIAKELRATFSGIFKTHQLRQLWGYKYGTDLQGIRTHADAAAININFWLTPDDANLNPERGGLEVFTAEAPRDWPFETFNRDHDAIDQLLESNGRKSIRVPHRANRAMIFDANLFHRTDDIHFKPGYTNRRLNITLLYGNRKRTHP